MRIAGRQEVAPAQARRPRGTDIEEAADVLGSALERLEDLVRLFRGEKDSQVPSTPKEAHPAIPMADLVASLPNRITSWVEKIDGVDADLRDMFL